MHVTENVCNKKRKQNASEKFCFSVPEKPKQYRLMETKSKDFKIHPGWT